MSAILGYFSLFLALIINIVLESYRCVSSIPVLVARRTKKAKRCLQKARPTSGAWRVGGIMASRAFRASAMLGNYSVTRFFEVFLSESI